MTKSKKRTNSISLERLRELMWANIIASTGASTRLAGSKLSNKEVERVINETFQLAISTPKPIGSKDYGSASHIHKII